jgi:hypothetical protein
MSEARTADRTGSTFISDGDAFVDVEFESPLPDLGYEVFFGALQVGTYDIWATQQTELGFRLNIDPVADGFVSFSYLAKQRSDVSGVALIQSLTPAVWFRRGIGITEAGGLVSQWDDQSGNDRHLKQATGTNQPSAEADGSILFDGIDNYMKCDAFPLVQPMTYYLLMKVVTWADSSMIAAGDTGFSPNIYLLGTPGIYLWASIDGPNATALPAGTPGVICGVFDGASSVIEGASEDAFSGPNIGDTGVHTDAGGLTLAASPGGASQFCNLQIYEVIICPGAHDVETRLRVRAHLGQVGGLVLVPV